MKKEQTRILACVCIFLVLCYSFGVLLPHTHECMGENCVICSFFELLKNVFAVALPGAAAVFSTDTFCKLIAKFREIPSAKRETLILLKVKLSR